ncbi:MULTISPECIES: AI-2E family transporter [Rhodobacterales]|jgi:predicted PurR-regulated permease PerM|uniref:AI-2E family transporter n=1 Tax=Rhodobacterales TaxID=204455 RepID=UPI00237F1353|nr:AI-2E family transporter [Phaeobacter gallaeciensis]MDE4142424.1 AI-2E family transporter [Phaeobacter gallaeciensis]MDE4150940.1 AI-2E family transporter [Phaeobacter gallaeciensis]MDE4155098.1 AI-2E family transporter [Phaeobacter gallaeciensis]MDE4230559.1 AI-2E family transporter [Phaeobacter gallaeciensis]MDE4259565.1 AI-2E family transporter [Phaeobacter gallaeciensis]
MALPAKKQFQYWGVAAVVCAIVLWALGDVLLPFVLGAAIAYLIDPIADRLEAAGLSRTAATAVITIGAMLVFMLLLLVVVPTLIYQLSDLIRVLPEAFRDLRNFAQEHFPSIFTEGSRAQQTIASIAGTLQGKGIELFESLVGSAVSVVNLLVLFVIVPVVSVYLLLDWDRMIERIDALLPLDHAPVIRKLAGEIDDVLASFIRGMGTVCLILGVYYAVALMLVGLNFGLAVGFIAGLVTFIPYLGALVGGALAIGLALFQFWGEWWSIGLVAGIFALGQVIEGNYLTPKLVGGSVGLHPVWLLLALSVFGALFGFVGMLVAVPVAAALGVVARFLTGQYLHSRLYQGLSHRDSKK